MQMTTDLETRRAENRALMPQTAALFDHVTAIFGPGCKLRYASENGRVVGDVSWAYRRRGVDAIPGLPPTHKHEVFRTILRDEFYKKYRREPVTADAVWVAYVHEEMAKRFDAFIP